MATFVSGFIVGFTAAWQLALVTLAVVPLIAVIGGLSAAALAKFSSKSQDELSKASNIADQVIHFLIHFTYCLHFFLFVSSLGLLFKCLLFYFINICFRHWVKLGLCKRM